MKAIRSFETKKNIEDLKGWVIGEGTTLHVMKEGPKHPTEGYRVLVVRVDNGTGQLDLMPETAIRDNQLGAKMDDQEKFKKDMERAGYEVEDYNGRFFYRGYAVRCEREQEQDVIRATKVRLQKDQMGLGLILYPVKSR